MLPTAAWGQDLADALMAQHTRTGAHGAITATSVTNSGNGSVGGNLTVAGTLGVTGATTLAGLLTPNGGLAANSVTFAALLSTIFSGQVTTYTNPGTAGGTNSFFYINLGGIKLFWGLTAAQSASTGGTSYTITLPAGFFSSVQHISSTSANMGSVVQQTAPIASYSTATVSLYFVETSAGAGTQQASVLVIGT